MIRTKKPHRHALFWYTSLRFDEIQLAESPRAGRKSIVFFS